LASLLLKATNKIATRRNLVDKRTFIDEHRNKVRGDSRQGETAWPVSWQKSSHGEERVLASVLVTAMSYSPLQNK